MGTSSLHDIYTRSLRAEGVYTRWTMNAHGITTVYIACSALSKSAKTWRQLYSLYTVYTYIVWVLTVSFSYDVSVMMLLRILSKIITYLKLTIKPHKLHYIYNLLGSAVGSAEEDEVNRTHSITTMQHPQHSQNLKTTVQSIYIVLLWALGFDCKL